MLQGERKSVACMLLGNGGVGKTTLLITHSSGALPGEYIPTIFDSYSMWVYLDLLLTCEASSGLPRFASVHVLFWWAGNTTQLITVLDTTDNRDDCRLRDLCYTHSQVVLLCFSVVDQASFNAVSERARTDISKTNVN